MKYLVGDIIVSVHLVEAKDAQSAIKLLRKPIEHRTTEDQKNIQKTAYNAGWIEPPGLNPIPVRDQVLANFLKLMSETIPLNPDSKPSPIIQVPPGSLSISEDTKIEDHESN